MSAQAKKQEMEISRQEKVIERLQESVAEILEMIVELGCELEDVEEGDESAGD